MYELLNAEKKFYEKKNLKKVSTKLLILVSKLDSKLNSTQKVGRLHITTTPPENIKGRKKENTTSSRRGFQIVLIS